MIRDVEGTKFTLIDQAMKLVGPTYGVEGMENLKDVHGGGKRQQISDDTYLKTCRASRVDKWVSYVEDGGRHWRRRTDVEIPQKNRLFTCKANANMAAVDPIERYDKLGRHTTVRLHLS